MFESWINAFHWTNSFQEDNNISFPNTVLIHWIVIYQVPVVQTLDSTIQRTNRYPEDKYYENQLSYLWIVIYPVDNPIQCLNKQDQGYSVANPAEEGAYAIFLSLYNHRTVAASIQ